MMRDPEIELGDLCSARHAEAFALRSSIAQRALELRNSAAAASGLPVLPSVEAYAAELARRTVCLSLLAGSGSRWVRSLAAAREAPERPSYFDPSFDPASPRGLYRVADFLGIGGAQSRVPVAIYSLAAVRGLGRHLVVVRGWSEAIDAEVLSPLGIGPDRRDFFTQEAPFGKPLGHGDAAWQCRSHWSGADYVVTNFGGDANSRLTILSSLLAMDALTRSRMARDAAGEGRIDLLLPAAFIPSPAYPISLDEAGLPRSFGHAKLQGRASLGETVESHGYTNVGLRVYRATALLEKVESFRSRFWTEGEGYAIPGNDPEGHEFALDNLDAELAREGRARILALSRPEELTPAKSLDEIPAFERAIKTVINEDRRSGF